MIKNSGYMLVAMCLACFIFMNCNMEERKTNTYFDELKRTILVGNWQFALNVENQNKKQGAKAGDLNNHYLKATLYLSNIKTKKSLLYSVSEDEPDYEAKYKYLSFDSGGDLYIKYKDELIYPIGYVFEPSNGLSTSERLVYKFEISDDVYKRLKEDSKGVEYWYIDRLIGLGKICFTHNN